MHVSPARGCETTCETVCFRTNNKFSHVLYTSHFSSTQLWFWGDASAIFPSQDTKKKTKNTITHLWGIFKVDSWSALDGVFKTSKVTACYKKTQLTRCQKTFLGLPEDFGRRKKGFGSLVKRQENMHKTLFTQNCRKDSRIRIKVQVPSVWRADVYLADNYNPFKANKSTIMLLQHEGSQAGDETGSCFLIGCQLMGGRKKLQCPQWYQA